MKVYTYSEARQRLTEVLDLARTEDVAIRRRGGETFVLRYERATRSPLDIPGIKTKASMKDILDAISEVRDGPRRTRG